MNYFENQSTFKDSFLFLSPLGPIEATYKNDNKWLVTHGLGVHKEITGSIRTNMVEIYNKIKG